MGELNREQFIEKVISAVRARFPLVKLARAEQQSFSLTVNGDVASLESLYRAVNLHPQSAARQIERWMVELLRAAEGQPDQTASYDQVKDRILPMILAREPGADLRSRVISQPFVADLHIAYAIDGDRMIAYIPEVAFNGWGISIDELHSTALANLTARSEAMQAHGVQGDGGEVLLMLFQKLDGYDASRVLLPTLHDRLREHLGTPFAAAIPNRDVLLCFRNDPANVQRIREQVGIDYRHMPHQVTDRLLLVTADGIAAHDAE